MLMLDDVAQQLGITSAQVHELVRSGQLSASRQDGQLQFTQEDVNAYSLELLVHRDTWGDDDDDE